MTQNTKQYFEWEDEPKSAHASECGLKVKGGWSAIY